MVDLFFITIFFCLMSQEKTYVFTFPSVTYGITYEPIREHMALTSVFPLGTRLEISMVVSVSLLCPLGIVTVIPVTRVSIRPLMGLLITELATGNHPLTPLTPFLGSHGEH